jgi:hypothetical protein
LHISSNIHIDLCLGNTIKFGIQLNILGTVVVAACVVEYICYYMVYRHPIYHETLEKVVRLKKLVGDEPEEDDEAATKKSSKVTSLIYFLA